MQLVKGRQALIRYLAFDHLRNKIDWEGTALTFVDGLLIVLAKEGKEELSRFLALLEQSDFLGLDQREGLNSLCKSITVLSNEQWELEFLNVRHFPFPITKTASEVIVNVLIGFLNNIDYEAAASISSHNRNNEFKSLLQKTELALVDKVSDERPELIVSISSFLKLPEVEEIMRQFYASRLLRSSERGNLDVIHRELRLLLSLHTPLRGGKLTDTSKILFDAIIVGCDQALQTAKGQGIIAVSEEKSAFYNFMLTDYTVAIAKNVDFLVARRKFDIETVLDFEEKYRQQVAERHNSIRPPFIDAAKEVPMNKLYVACGIRAGSRSHDKQQQLISISTFRSTIYRTVLLGNPGGGKSTFASKLCYDLATNYTDHPLPGRQVTPILVVLRKYGEKKKTHHYSILKFIEVTAESDYQIPSLPSGAFEYLLRNGRALVIFDGLDELLDTNDRQEISKDVELFCSMYPTVPVLVTSREVGYDQAPLNEEHFRTYHLTSFNEAQVREYVTMWFTLVQSLTEEDRRQRIDSFMKESQQVPDLRSNPLMLALMCNIYRGEGYIPENRPDLYEKCADMLFKQWDKGRGITMQVALSPRTRYTMMFLAHWIYTHSALQEGVTESQLIAEATTHLCPRPYEDRDEAKQAACEIVEFCRGRAWVFTDTGTTKTGEKLYQFTHRTFLEFFTAAHLVRTHSTPPELVNLLLPKIVAKEWDVVAQLAFHMLARQTAGAEDTLLTMLLDHLQEMPDQEAWNIISFTARCLAFILPSQVVICRITIICGEHWLVEQNKRFSMKDEKGRTSRSVTLIGELLVAAAAVEN